MSAIVSSTRQFRPFDDRAMTNRSRHLSGRKAVAGRGHRHAAAEIRQRPAACGRERWADARGGAAAARRARENVNRIRSAIGIDGGCGRAGQRLREGRSLDRPSRATFPWFLVGVAIRGRSGLGGGGPGAKGNARHGPTPARRPSPRRCWRRIADRRPPHPHMTRSCRFFRQRMTRVASAMEALWRGFQSRRT